MENIWKLESCVKLLQVVQFGLNINTTRKLVKFRKINFDYIMNLMKCGMNI